jgi:hypothetical protein
MHGARMKGRGSMRGRWITAILLVGAMTTTTGCSVFRPILFWRDAQIMGRTKLASPDGTLLEAPLAGISLNFIPRDARIEDSLLSVQTDPSGSFVSPVLVPGEYTVEALMPGYAIESEMVQVRDHEHKRVDFLLRKINEQAGRSLREAEDDNIPHPGEVQILPPPF